MTKSVIDKCKEYLRGMRGKDAVSPALLMRKFKITHKKAVEVIKESKNEL